MTSAETKENDNYFIGKRIIRYGIICQCIEVDEAGNGKFIPVEDNLKKEDGRV